MVAMGLSWRIKAQATQRNADSWIIVHDLTWVIHQMHTTGSGTPMHMKRARDEDNTNEAKRRFRKRCLLFYVYY